MNKLVIIILFLSQISINLFAQKGIEFTVKTANVYPFGTFVYRNGKAIDTDILNIYFKFTPYSNEKFLLDILPYALTQDFTEFNFDSISDINENLLLQNKSYDLRKILQKSNKPHVIIETKSGHLYKFLCYPFVSNFDKKSFYLDYKTSSYNPYYVDNFGLDNLTDSLAFDYYFYKKNIPNIKNDSLVRFHLIQSTNILLKSKGFKAKIYTSNWVTYPSINTKKYYDKIDTTILGILSYWYHLDYKDTHNKYNFIAFILLRPEIYLNENYINRFDKIDSTFTNNDQSYFKTKNYTIRSNFFSKNDSIHKNKLKIYKTVNLKCTNDTFIEQVYFGIYLNDPIKSAAKRLVNYGYTIINIQKPDSILLSNNETKSLVFLKGKNGKLNEILIEYK